ncbi:MAG: hypothetical protein AB1498_08995 [bacterium]
MKKSGFRRLLSYMLSLFLIIGFLGCSRPRKGNEEQKGSSWEKDMNKLIEKATPKEKDK